MTRETHCYYRTYKGRSKAGEMARLIYVGVKEGLLYIAPFVEQRFFDHSIEQQEGTVEWGELCTFVEQNNAEMKLLMAPSEVIQRCWQPGDILGVSRIHQKVDVSSDWGDVQNQLSRRENKRRVQLVEKGFSFNVSLEDEDFFTFYRLMHLPTMSERYGVFARSVPEQAAYLQLFKKGMLFRIYLNSEWVAGSVSQLDAATRTLNSRLIGVKDGAEIYRANGAQNFVYHAILEWAAHHSLIDNVDFQGCEPFLTKGTFQYKKRFGAQAVIPNNAFGQWRLLIRPHRLCASTKQFLIDNPLIGLDDEGNLQAQYFFDANHQIRSDIPFASKGIHSYVSQNLDQRHD